jgi:hypothetical protein
MRVKYILEREFNKRNIIISHVDCTIVDVYVQKFSELSCDYCHQLVTVVGQ